MHSFTCTKCSTSTSIDASYDIIDFGCPNCNSLFTVKNGVLDFKKQYRNDYLNLVLPIGLKGNFDGVEYEIVCAVVKKVVDSIFYMREYTLKSKNGEYLYLSEGDGHWILLKDVSSEISIQGKPLSVGYGEIEHDIYGYTVSQIVGAYGFFDFQVPASNSTALEYINPPYILSREIINSSTSVYHGKHISKAQVKKAFNYKQLPYQHGTGIVQPFYFNKYHTLIIFIASILLILATNMFINEDRTSPVVLNTELKFSDYSSKEFVSPSFELKGGSAPLNISLASEVNNSWASAGVSLVNESTSEERFAEKDVEFYHGYTEGESWSEGSQNTDFNICGVGPGKYHLVITPSHQDTDSGNLSIGVRAMWSSASNWNFGVCILILGVLIVGVYVWSYFFEKKRWEDSEYSVYEYEEE